MFFDIKSLKSWSKHKKTVQKHFSGPDFGTPVSGGVSGVEPAHIGVSPSDTSQGGVPPPFRVIFSFFDTFLLKNVFWNDKNMFYNVSKHIFWCLKHIFFVLKHIF